MPAKLTMLDGGGGNIPEPDWALVFNDELEQLAAKEHWRIIVQELARTEKLASVNAHAVKRLVIYEVLHDKAAQHVIEQGAIKLTEKTKVPQYNLHFTVMAKMHDAIMALESELTLSPRRRNNGGKAQKGKRSASPAAAYLHSAKPSAKK